MTTRDSRRLGAEPRRWRLVQAGRDAVSPTARWRVRRPPRDRRRVVWRWLAVAMALVTCGAVGWLLYGTKVFAVTQVRVEGVRVLTVEQVRRVAHVRTGTPLARLDADAIGRRVSRLAPVRRVVVQRDWPSTVVIQVHERAPMATVSSARGFLILDGSGVVFDIKTRRSPRLPLIEVAKPGPKDGATQDALRVLDSLTDALRSALVKVAAPSPTRIKLYLTGGRTVVWGDSEQSDKKAEVATALLRHSAKVIDVSAPEVVTTR